MYHPTTRLLTALELLQSRDRIMSAEFASRLEVDPRSVRRYITMLQDLGIPVESERGRYGGYRLKAGFKLPPLMFTEEEALALTLGLLTVRQVGLELAAPAVEGAIAKVERVLPAALRARIQILQEVTAFDLPEARIQTDRELMILLSEAIYHREQVHLSYRSEQQVQTEREVDPYGLVHWSGRWYVVGYCYLRKDLRVFRLDRVLGVKQTSNKFVRPEIDCLEFLLDNLANMMSIWEVEVQLELSLEEASQKIPRLYGTLEQINGKTIYRTKADDLDMVARYISRLGCKFAIKQPQELREALKKFARELYEMADLPASV